MAPITIVGMCWYTREDFPRIREIMTDDDNLHDTFDEWQAAAELGERNLQSQGHRVVRTVVKPNEFLAWCRERNLQPNARGRTEFANFFAAQQIRS
jgi:hypothetical protein